MTLFLYDGGTGGQFSKVTHIYKFNYKTYNFSTIIIHYSRVVQTNELPIVPL